MPLRSKHIVLILISLLCSCTKPEQGNGIEPKLSVPLTELSAKTGQQFIAVEAGGSWTLSLEPAEAAEWIELSQSSGSGSKRGIVLTWQTNSESEARTSSISLKAGSKSDSKTLTQQGKDSPSIGGGDWPSTTSARWLELPATDNPKLQFITHDMTRGSKKMRNYSCYYDREALLSHWVAYPLNRSLVGSGSRSDEWGYDPSIDSKYQPRLYKGYGGSYDRGHQIPSADRLERKSNVATFYFTNMTPQRGNLNQQAWASLEVQVREWSYQFDTLYVVTGADIIGASTTTTDNEGARCLVPTGYYKALLGYKRNSFNSTAGFTGIAFYFEHKQYNNSRSTILNQKMSIDALEKKLGVDFFVNLPSATNEQIADKVEATLDPWWESAW